MTSDIAAPVRYSRHERSEQPSPRDEHRQKPCHAATPRPARALRGDRGREIRDHRPAGADAYLVEMRDLFHGPRRWCCGRARSRKCRRSSSSRTRRTRRSCRRAAIPASSAARRRISGEVVLSLNRLDRIREVDRDLEHHHLRGRRHARPRARGAAEAVDRLYPLLLPSEGTCTIGGNLSTNAGGTQALSYGIARTQALGLEVVLADGRVLNNLNKLKKDNTGYDLQESVHRRGRHARHHHRGGAAAAPAPALGRDRVCRRAVAGGGARAARPRHRAHRRRRHQLRADGAARHRVVLRHAPACAIRCAEPHPWYVLIELSSQARPACAQCSKKFWRRARARPDRSTPRSPTASSRAKAFWRIREMFGEMQRHEGGSIKHDVSVPVAAVPAFIKEANAAVTALIPGARPLPFGHIGDGNIHYNIAQPVGADKAEYLEALARGERGGVRHRRASSAARSRPSTASA